MPIIHRSHQRSSSAGSRNGQPLSLPGANVLMQHHPHFHQTNHGICATTSAYQNIRIPHTFMVHTYGIPTVCQFCKKLLKGLFKQGLQCRDCQYNTHKKCMDKVPQDCTGEKQMQPHDFNETPTHQLNHVQSKEKSDNFFKEEFDDSDFDDNVVNDFNGRTAAGYAAAKQGARMPGGHMSGVMRATTNAHNSPPELVNGLISSGKERSGYVGSTVATSMADKRSGSSSNSESRSVGEGQSLDGQSEQSSSSSSPSANIPLMRIVQSVKHTKKRDGQAIKQGWLIHFTSLDSTVKRYFWRLDTKTITLFMSEQGSKYHKEILLSEIQAIKSNNDIKANNNYCFELKLAALSYFVGQDPLAGVREEQAVRLPPPESGIGTDIAKSWETSIKQAYIHVNNTRKFRSVLVLF